MTRTTRIIMAISLGLVVLLLALVAGSPEGRSPTTLTAVLLAIAAGLFLFLGEALSQVVGFAIGYYALPLITFGRAHAEASTEEVVFPWYGVARVSSGKLVVETEAVSVVGLVVVVVAFVAAVLGYHALT